MGSSNSSSGSNGSSSGSNGSSKMVTDHLGSGGDGRPGAFSIRYKTTFSLEKPGDQKTKFIEMIKLGIDNIHELVVNL